MSHEARKHQGRRAVFVAIAGLSGLLGLWVGCENSDPIAPEGSTVTVTANPQTVVVQSGIPGQSTITATVRGSNGTRLPDQEVTFETTAGILTPSAQTALTTNSNGQVTSVLETGSTATVTATSGTISGSTTVQTASGNLSSINLNVTPNNIDSCSTPDSQVTLTVTAEDPNGNGVGNVDISFVTSKPNNLIELPGNFNPTQPKTDVNGIATSVWTAAQNFCTQSCQGAACGVQVYATDRTGAFTSPVVIITESVP